jgi:HlyD family secretion protein
MKRASSTLKFILIALAIIIVLGAAFYFWRAQKQAASSTTYQTAEAVRGTLTASVGATGTVRAGQSASLTWLTSGHIKTVEAKIGQVVAVDQVLATLDQASMNQSIILAEADLVSAEKALKDLQESGTALAKAEQALAVARQAVDDAQGKVDGLTQARASDNLIAQTKANIDLARQQVQDAEDNFKLFQSKPDGDTDKARALLTLTTARQNLTTQISNYNWYTATATPLDVEKYQADLALALAQLEDAQREVDRLKNGPNQDDIAAAEARIAAAQSTLNQARITAPFSGTITQGSLLPGDVVSPGTQAFRIDDLSHLLVDLQISEVDINNVSVGQTVTVSFDAVQGKNYSGVVSQIGQAGSVTANGVNFTVTVELTEADELVKPGMTAAVTITVREVKDALLVPNRAVRQVNGKRVVYVLKDGQAVQVEIRLGATSDTNSEVVGGDLKEGDLIILNPPSNSQFGPGGGGPFGG